MQVEWTFRTDPWVFDSTGVMMQSLPLANIHRKVDCVFEWPMFSATLGEGCCCYILIHWLAIGAARFQDGQILQGLLYRFRLNGEDVLRGHYK